MQTPTHPCKRSHTHTHFSAARRAANRGRRQIVNVQPARETDTCGIGHGLSERDFMSRQRYLENSGYGVGITVELLFVYAPHDVAAECSCAIDYLLVWMLGAAVQWALPHNQWGLGAVAARSCTPSSRSSARLSPPSAPSPGQCRWNLQHSGIYDGWAFLGRYSPVL